MKITKGVKLDDELEQRIEALAKLRDRTAHWIMCAAIKHYVEVEEKIEQEKADDKVRWEAYQLTGHFISDEKTMAWLDELEGGKLLPCPK